MLHVSRPGSGSDTTHAPGDLLYGGMPANDELRLDLGGTAATLHNP